MSEPGYAVRKIINRDSLWHNDTPLLTHLDIELSERCNNACLHCYINRPAEDVDAIQRELSTTQWQDILRQASELGTLTVRFSGGEPLLREDFPELYLFARQLGMKVLLFTNARLITPKLADLFARIPPLEKIEVTVYGMRAESYEAAACAPGAYPEFLRGVQNLLDRQVPFIVKYALLPGNKKEIDEFDQWAATLPGNKNSPAYVVTLNQRGRRGADARRRLIEKARLSPDEGLAVQTRDERHFRDEMQQFCSRFMGPEGDTLFTCGAGKTGCVDAYGFYQPCMLLRDPALVYDMRTGSLRDALVNFFPRLKEIKATNPLYLERCARCFLHGLCEQCPAKSWMEQGTLDTPVEYFCQVAHAQARFLGLLNEGERAWEIQDWEPRVERMQERNI